MIFCMGARRKIAIFNDALDSSYSKIGCDVVVGLAPQIDCDPDGDDAVLVDYNERLKAYCKEQGLLYIDFYKTIAEADYRGEILYAGDVHPNELGYHYMYETARDVLKAGL